MPCEGALSVGNRFNIILAFVIALAWLPVAFIIYSSYPKYLNKFDLWLNPVLEDYEAANWTLNKETRFWSARIYGEKIDQSCIYVKGQDVSATVQISPESIPFEASVKFLNDDSPDSNRPVGYQDFGRWQFEAPNITLGAIIRVSVKHNCPARNNNPIVTEISPPFIVGQ